MLKYFYAVIIMTTTFGLKGFSQALPPVINSYSDTVASNYAILYLNFNPNSNGPVKAEVQLQEGAGNNYYDSTFTLPATDSGNAALNLSPLTPCTSYQLLINMSNDSAQGLVINPLVSFTTLCAAGIAPLNENNYTLIASSQSIELKTGAIPQNGIAGIYDLIGKQLLTIPLNQPIQQIPFHPNAGMYLLRVTGNGQELFTNRFVIY